MNLLFSLGDILSDFPHLFNRQISVQKVCEHIDIHWYQRRPITQGLRIAYLQSQIKGFGFSTALNCSGYRFRLLQECPVAITYSFFCYFRPYTRQYIPRSFLVQV